MATDRLVHILADPDRSRELKRLLHAAGLTTVVYETAHCFLEAAPGLRDGCLLLDLTTPGVEGSALQAQLKVLGVRLPLIAMTPKSDVITAVAAMKAGAVDFIEGEADDRRLLAAIEKALADAEDEGSVGETAQAARRLAVLSDRERQVLDEIVAGKPNKVIAHKLAISMRTVEVHRARILKRLGIRSIAEAIGLSALAALASSEEVDQKLF